TFRSNNAISKELSLLPPYRGEIQLPMKAASADATCGVAFGGSGRRIRICDIERLHQDAEHAVRDEINAQIRRIVPMRLHQKVSVYFEADLSSVMGSGPLGELPTEIIDELKGGIESFFTGLESWHEFRGLVQRAEAWSIDEESKQLARRKARG